MARPYIIIGAYAAIRYSGPKLQIDLSSVRSTEREARRAASYPTQGHAQTWKQLYAQGWRIAPVVVHD